MGFCNLLFPWSAALIVFLWIPEPNGLFSSGPFLEKRKSPTSFGLGALEPHIFWARSPRTLWDPGVLSDFITAWIVRKHTYSGVTCIPMASASLSVSIFSLVIVWALPAVRSVPEVAEVSDSWKVESWSSKSHDQDNNSSLVTNTYLIRNELMTCIAYKSHGLWCVTYT